MYRHYGTVGGKAIAPEVLLGLLVYGYANGVFSSRRIERATYENLAFRFVAVGWRRRPGPRTAVRSTLFSGSLNSCRFCLFLSSHSGRIMQPHYNPAGPRNHPE